MRPVDRTTHVCSRSASGCRHAPQAGACQGPATAILDLVSVRAATTGRRGTRTGCGAASPVSEPRTRFRRRSLVKRSMADTPTSTACRAGPDPATSIRTSARTIRTWRRSSATPKSGRSCARRRSRAGTKAGCTAQCKQPAGGATRRPRTGNGRRCKQKTRPKRHGSPARPHRTCRTGRPHSAST